MHARFLLSVPGAGSSASWLKTSSEYTRSLRSRGLPGGLPASLPPRRAGQPTRPPLYLALRLPSGLTAGSVLARGLTTSAARQATPL